MERSIIYEACDTDDCFDFTNEDWFDEYLQNNFNTYLVAVPDTKLDWIEIINYANEYGACIQFPLEEILLYNQYRYAVVSNNREEIMETIKKGGHVSKTF